MRTSSSGCLSQTVATLVYGLDGDLAGSRAGGTWPAIGIIRVVVLITCIQQRDPIRGRYTRQPYRG